MGRGERPDWGSTWGFTPTVVGPGQAHVCLRCPQGCGDGAVSLAPQLIHRESF